MVNEISPSDFKPMMTAILGDIDRWCSERGLRYSLAFGTLIGAVRHKGFIPWDDDIDIWMPRPDYERFIKEYDHEYFKVLSYMKTPGYSLEYAKVHDSRTIVTEAGVDVGWGISIDIFPVDGIPDRVAGEKLARKVSSARRLLANQRFTYKLKLSRTAGLKKNASIVAGKLIHPFLPVRWVVERVDKVMKAYDYDSCSFIGDFCDLKPFIVEKSFLENFVDLDFDGHSFKASAEYDRWLKGIFGDYMQLPPEEQRVSNHGIKAYWR